MAAETARQRLSRELLFASFARPTTEVEDPRSFEKIAALVEASTVRAGDVLYREGEPSEHVYFMIEGRLRLSAPRLVDWVYEGWWVIGTTDVLARRPRRRTATIETDTRLSRIPAERWFEIMRDRPEVLLDTIAGFARGAAQLYAQLAPDGAFPSPLAPPTHRFDLSTLAGRARLLASSPLLHGVSVQLLAEIAASAECHDLAPGEPLAGPGEPRRVFVVAEGGVEVIRDEPALRAVFTAGSLVGGTLGLAEAQPGWVARAVGPARVLSFLTDDLFDLLEGHHHSVRGLMATIAIEQERVREELAARTGELILR